MDCCPHLRDIVEGYHWLTSYRDEFPVIGTDTPWVGIWSLHLAQLWQLVEHRHCTRNWTHTQTWERHYVIKNVTKMRKLGVIYCDIVGHILFSHQIRMLPNHTQTKTFTTRHRHRNWWKQQCKVQSQYTQNAMQWLHVSCLIAPYPGSLHHMSQSAAARTTFDGTDLAGYELQLKRKRNEQYWNEHCTQWSIAHNIWHI